MQATHFIQPKILTRLYVFLRVLKIGIPIYTQHQCLSLPQA